MEIRDAVQPAKLNQGEQLVRADDWSLHQQRQVVRAPP